MSGKRIGQSLIRLKHNPPLCFNHNCKSATSKALHRKFADKIKNKLWKDVFWSGSYCLITTGQTTLEQVKKYIESQKDDSI